MKPIIYRVSQIDRVSSRNKTKIFSPAFVLFLISANIFLFGTVKRTIASDITAEKVFELTDESRDQTGEGPLILNSKLVRAANKKADDMITNNYFSHTSPEGVTPWKWIDAESYDYNYAGENLAMDFQSAEKMEDAWMASPTHRANILNSKYKEIGVAVKLGNLNGHQTILAVVMFGSGDKNAQLPAINQPETTSTEQEKPVGNILPILPAAQMKNTLAYFQEPVITSPQVGEFLSNNKVDIFGRAKPGSEISILDNGNLFASATTDAGGWFSLLGKNFTQGRHELSLENENIISEKKWNFSIDLEKPQIDYRLYADENNPHQFFLEAKADKDDCSFEFNKDTRRTDSKGKALFSIAADKSSAIIRIFDQAGNKNFRQINLANYYAPEKQNLLSEKLAMLILPRENIFTAESGRDAIKNNFGIAPHQFLASRIADKN